MAKQRGRPTTGRDDVSVKLDRGIVSKAKMVASQQGITLAELLSGLLKEPVDKAFAKVVKELDSKG